MAFSEQFISQVRAKLAISVVVGERTKLVRGPGGRFEGRSPFGETAGTIVVDDAEECFEDKGAGKSGDIFDFIVATENCSLDDAVRRAAVRAGVELEGERKTNGAHPPPGDDLVDLERALIGLIIVRPEIYDEIIEIVGTQDFSVDLHGRIYGAIEAARLADQNFKIENLIAAVGGDPKAIVFAGSDYTVASYVAYMAAHAPASSDRNGAIELAQELRKRVDIERGVREPDPSPPQPYKSKFGGIPFEELDAPGPEHEYIIDGWLTVGDKSIIGGPSKSGKSFLAIHACGCIATGMDFFGAKVMTPGLVIYQAGEGVRGVKKRFRAWRQHFDVEREQRVPIFILQSKIDLYRADGDTGALIEEIKGIQTLYDVPLRALFIDTLATATGGADENSGKDMSTVMANVDRLAKAIPGCHVSLVHHFNAAGTRLRGHSSIYNNIDQVVLVTRDEATKIRSALLDKQKDDKDETEIKFRLFPVEVGRRLVDSKPITSCIVESIGGAAEGRTEGPRGQIIRLTAERSVVLQALKNALENHGIEKRKCSLKAITELPNSIKAVVDVRHWKAEYLAIAPDADTIKDNTLNKRLRDASNQFQVMKIIARINPYVWLTSRATGSKVEVEDHNQAAPETRGETTGGGQNGLLPDELPIPEGR